MFFSSANQLEVQAALAHLRVEDERRHLWLGFWEGEDVNMRKLSVLVSSGRVVLIQGR